MQSDPQPIKSSSRCPPSNPRETSDVELDELPGPSMSNIILIKRTTPEDIKIFYRSTIDVKLKFFDPVSFLLSNVDHVQKKYSKKNKRRAKDNLVAKLRKHFGKFPFMELHDILECEISDEIKSLLFFASVYTIENYFGKPAPKSADSNSLYLYIHELFNINKNQKNASFEHAKHTKPPEFLVKLFILEASSLKHIKNASHFCCKAWLNKDSKLAETTQFVETSSHPVWNVRFYFIIKNIKTDVITIEMRSTENKDQIKDVSKYGCAERILKSSFPIGEEDYNLIGKVHVKVSDIYSEGTDEWLAIECSKSDFGIIFLHIRVKFDVTPCEKFSHGLKRHMILIKACIEDNISQAIDDQRKIYNWKGVLNKSALTLIFLHGVISYLSESEDLLCRFVMITHIGINSESISYEFFHYLLQNAEKYSKRFQDSIDTNLLLTYENEVENLYNYCFKFVGALHFHNIVKYKHKLLEFEFAVRNMYLCEDVIHVSGAPYILLKSEAVTWFQKETKDIMQASPLNRASSIINFLEYTYQYQKVVDKVVQEITSHETYTELIYKEMEDILLQPLKHQISEISQFLSDIKDTACDKDNERLMEESLELFAKMKQLVHYISNTVNVPVSQLKLGAFWEWFGTPVMRKWFEYRELKVESEIRKAVEFDDLRQLDISVFLAKSFKESASARKTLKSIELLLVELWASVSCPRSRACDDLFEKSLHRSCMKYSDFIMELIHSRKLLDKFYSTGGEHLCILANNLWLLAEFADLTLLNTIGKIPNMPDSKLSLEVSCEDICMHIVEKYSTNISHLLGGMVENEEDVSFKRYINYIEKIVWEEVYIDASFDVFIIFLKILKKRIINLLRQLVQKANVNVKDPEEERQFFTLLIKITVKTKETCWIPDNQHENDSIWDECYATFLANLESRIPQGENR